MANKLFYGDNLAVLRENIASESVDLIYLDPEPSGKTSLGKIPPLA
jgi:DNA modification methylase